MRFINLKITWKFILILFLVCTLGTTFFINVYIRGQMELALFQAFLFVIWLIFSVPFLYKLGSTIIMKFISYKIVNDKSLRSDLVNSVISTGLAIHDKNETDIDIIVVNLAYIIKAISPNYKPHYIKLNKDFDLDIDGKKVSLNNSQIYEINSNLIRLRIEIQLLMSKKIKLNLLEDLLNKKISSDWDNINLTNLNHLNDF